MVKILFYKLFYISLQNNLFIIQFIMAKKRTWAEFLEKAKEIYGDRIEFLNEEGIEFATNNTKIKCMCKKCGNIITDSVNNILYGKNRLRCCEAYKDAFKTQDYVLKRLKETLGEENYDFSEVEYKGANKNVKVICKKHGAFWATPNNLYAGKGCKLCHSSKLEKTILTLLKNNNIEFITEYKISKKSLDFYLPKYNIAIECQGIQHFKPIDFFGGEKIFNYQKENDKIKYNLCKENNIKLIYFFNKLDDYKSIIYENKFHGIYNENNVFENEDDILNFIKNNSIE